MPYKFADIILPLAVRSRFTYSIPEQLAAIVRPGVRVVVQFGGKKLYSGIVCRVHDETPVLKNIRPLMEITDPVPVVKEIQLKFWEWLSEYYMCSEGEVMNAAVPSAMFP
jgi:primosomal protein N' (replication factor Y)